MSRKRILQLLHSLHTGGAEVLADRIGRHLSHRYDVLFACLDDVGEIGERLQVDGFHVEHIKRGSGIDFSCVRRLAGLVRRERVDLIHAHQYTPFFYSLAARQLVPRGWLGSLPIVFTEHGRFLPDYPRRKRMWFNRLMLGRGDRLFAVGHDVKRALVENEGLPAGRIDVIYNGIPVEAYRRELFPDARAWLNAQFGLPADAFVVVQVARLDYLKDHTTAIRATARAAQSTNIHLLLVGDGPERETIECEIREHGVDERVHVCGLRRDVPRILAGADALLLTSISEGIPLTLIEGMAAGLPIVSTNVGGIQEIVQDHVQGLLCDARDYDGLASRLVQLACGPDLRRQLGLAGLAAAEQRFSEATMLKRYDQAVDKLLNT